VTTTADATNRPWPRFSLLFFASEQADYSDGKFDLLRRSAAIADEAGFEAVWMPERHFHAFGGIFPNPALTAALLSETTERIRLRAGSVVLPLHSPIRVAEDWAVIDNMSNGRVDLAFAVGWNPNDFAIAPERYEERVQTTFEGIETVKKLWRGESIRVPNGLGKEIELRVYPSPRQPELHAWMTCSGGPERFRDAGARGTNILTALLFQSVDELAEKIASYRQAREAAGHEGPGHVTLMLHTFVGPDENEAKECVREPFKRYLESSVDLWRGEETRLDDLPPRKKADLLEFAFERYWRKTALMGSPESCRPMVEAVRRAGVDEIACLIDFGVQEDEILASLDSLDVLRRGPAPPAPSSPPPAASPGRSAG